MLIWKIDQSTFHIFRSQQIVQELRAQIFISHFLKAAEVGEC